MLRRSSHMVAMKEDQSSDNNGRHLMMGDRRGSVLNQSFEKRSMYAPRKSIFLGRRASYMSRKSSESYGLPKVKLQNTYRIELKENEKFNPSLVKPKMNDILEGALKDQEYNASNANILSKEISQDIVREIRTIAHGISPRYKIVSHVSIGQLKGMHGM